MRPAPPATEAEAYAVLEEQRWGGRPRRCPLCGESGRMYFLRPSGAGARATRTGAPTERRVWKCGVCRGQFSVLAGTVLQGTRISLRAWVGALSDWAATGAVPAVDALIDRYGVSRAAARHVRSRLALADEAVPARAGRGLAAVLRLPPEVAAAIRTRTSTRVRPRPQVGPTADYGSG